MSDENAAVSSSPFAERLELVEAECERKQQEIRRLVDAAQQRAQDDPATANNMGWRVLDLWAQSAAVNAEAEAAHRLAALGIAPPVTSADWSAVAELVGAPGESDLNRIERAAYIWAVNQSLPPEIVQNSAPTVDKDGNLL